MFIGIFRGKSWYNPSFCIPGHYASNIAKSAYLQFFLWFDLAKVQEGTYVF